MPLITISTGTFGKAFLVKAWQTRHELLDYERRGFAQFFYITICGHIEAVLADLIKRRLNFIDLAIRWDQLPPMRYTIDGSTHSCAIKPVAKSVRNLAMALENEANVAPFGKLSEIYTRVFGVSLSTIVGSELEQDVKALTTLRNLFAHSRDLIMELEAADESWTAFTGTMDGNALKHPAQRLHHAGVIKDFNITGQNHNDFQALFFSDEAMLYFYRAARQTEDRLNAAIDFLPERSWPGPRSLPELQP